MKFLVELDYNPEVVKSDIAKNLKNALEWSIKGLKVNEIYSNMKVDNSSVEETEIMIMEDKTAPITHKTRIVKDLSAKKPKYDERIISDHGKWKSYDDPDLIPTIEM